MGGHFSSKLDSSEAWLSVTIDDASEVTVVVGPTLLSVHATTGPNVEPACLTIPLGNPGGTRTTAMAATFERMDTFNHDSVNRFQFLGAQPEDGNTDLWYDPEDHAARFMQVRPQGHSGQKVLPLATFDLANWEEHTTHTEGNLFPPDDWNCQPASEQAQPWLQLADSQKVAQAHPLLPAVYGLHELVAAVRAVGLLPSSAAAVLPGLSINPKRLKQPASIYRPPEKPEWAPPVDLFGPKLKQMAFSFTSIFPTQGHLQRGGGAFYTEPGSYNAAREHGKGEVRVDLPSRSLFMWNEVTNVSAGIAKVESRIVYRGDEGRLYTHTRMDDFEQCWSVDTSGTIPSGVGPQINPFSRAVYSGDFSVPGTTQGRAKKYTMRLGPKKSIAFFVDDDKLVAFNVDDLERDATGGALVHDFTTGQVDKAWFEPARDWRCEDKYNLLDNAASIADWDILKVFFPRDELSEQELGWDTR